ncbi:MAG: DUF1571 domain-containing protein [Gemmataceae bacterium]|nr:DUF1571 domain-containing protein [Gemmataceae bacterium]
MHRLLLCLPLCLILGSDRHQEPPTSQPDRPTLVLKDDGGALPKPAEMEKLAKNDPLAFLENCLKRYDREVKGFTCVMQKQELIDGKLHPTEVMDVAFRNSPHAVYMEWQQGVRRAERVLFVVGENDDKMLCRPAGKLARAVAGDVVSRDVDGPDARSAGRYSLKEFGLRKALERVIVEWKAAREEGTLQVEYLGIKKVKEAGDRPCYTLRRTSKKPDRDGISECVLHIDTETWLQDGCVLKDEKGNLLGAYYWRDIKVNPQFKENQFKRAALIP